MTGLEKIIAQIKKDGDAACNEVLQKAQQQANEITARGEKEAEQAYNTAAENAKALYQTRRQKAQSAAEALQSRRALEARALLLEQTLAAVAEQLNALSGEEYFTALQGLLKKCRTGQPGEVLLNERDCNALAERLLTPYPELKAVPASLKNGFILRYGKVEQNCTFAALLREKRDELKDSLAAMLFA